MSRDHFVELKCAKGRSSLQDGLSNLLRNVHAVGACATEVWFVRENVLRIDDWMRNNERDEVLGKRRGGALGATSVYGYVYGLCVPFLRAMYMNNS
jgi:hypothetical protein